MVRIRWWLYLHVRKSRLIDRAEIAELSSVVILSDTRGACFVFTDISTSYLTSVKPNTVDIWYDILRHSNGLLLKCVRDQQNCVYTLWGKVPGSLSGHGKRRATFQFGCLYQIAKCWAEQSYAVIELCVYSITKRGLYFLCLYDQISILEIFPHLKILIS